MKKEMILGAFIFTTLLLTTGCSQTDIVNSVKNNAEIGFKNKANGFDIEGNQIKGSMGDLIVGTRVMAMGSLNSDGTVMANRIIFGNLGGFGQGMPSSTNANRLRMIGGNWQGGNNSGAQRSGGQGQLVGARGGMSGSTRVNGEIIKKDENSLVVKNIDGGSKIVYFSSSTEIFSMKLPTSTVELDMSTTTDTK